MGVPAHDERDFDFVKWNGIVNGNEIKKVVSPVVKGMVKGVIREVMHGSIACVDEDCRYNVWRCSSI